MSERELKVEWSKDMEREFVSLLEPKDQLRIYTEWFREKLAEVNAMIAHYNEDEEYRKKWDADNRGIDFASVQIRNRFIGDLAERVAEAHHKAYSRTPEQQRMVEWMLTPE